LFIQNHSYLVLTNVRITKAEKQIIFCPRLVLSPNATSMLGGASLNTKHRQSIDKQTKTKKG
jgi:hypothetical protein